ncbi:MAG: hypothetical protein V5A23_00050 [Halobacteriales archaeon]
MALTPDTVEALADDYHDTQPLAAIEDEHYEMLPSALAAGDFGWRDAEWIDQWFYRRFLGTYPDAARRERESAYGDNDYEAVRDAIAEAADAAETRAKLEALTTLSGVDVPVASAFLQFLDPEAYLVMSAREWTVLRNAGELDAAYPAEPDAGDYERYLSACRDVADRCGSDLRTVYRALWQRWATENR